MSSVGKPATVLEIGPVKYVIGFVPARQGLRAATLVGGALADALAAGERSTRAMIAGLLASPALDTRLDALCSIFAASTLVVQRGDDGSERSVSLESVFEAHFAGNYGSLLRWLKAAIESNLQSFFDELPGLLGNVGQAIEAGSVSRSPTNAGKIG